MSEPPVSIKRVPVDKRPLPYAANEPARRRAPYAQRACDACRRRKGRCDGCKPCGYCVGRSLQCCYSVSPQERQPNQPSTQHSSSNVNGTECAPYSVNGLVATIHGHLDTLAAHARTDTTIRIDTPDSPTQDCMSGAAATSTSSATSLSPATTTSRRPISRRYHGPTSPAYSLIAAQIQFEGNKQANANASGSGRARVPNFDESESDQDPAHSDDDDSVTSRRLVTPYSHPALFRSLDLFNKREAIRLLRVYHQVIGELHPICDIESLVEQMRRLHGASRNEQAGRGEVGLAADENDLLVLNLALSTALAAEASSESGIADTIYEHCRDFIDAKVTSRATGIKDVVVILMVGFYQFFKSKSRLAWRMCGLAGRMAMELGLHSLEAAQHYLENDGQREELATISCTLLVLDRQWSALTGLPSNFKESDFEMAKVSLARTPYLKEMMKLTLISHKFNEPISRVARGEFLDEDDVDLINFQVEQWRKRALENQNYTHPERWESTLSAKPPPWATILYLRANAVRGILMRPFFLSSTNSQLAAEKIRPGLEVVSDSLNVLAILDRTTDAYKKQHPNFQHFVASSCALLFLIVIYTKKHRIAFSSEFAAEYSRSVRRNFEIASKLSAAYSESSRASRKLWKRLQSVGDPLFRWGVPQEESLRNPAATDTSATTADSRPPINNTPDISAESVGRQQQLGSGNPLPTFPNNDLPFLDAAIPNTVASSDTIGGLTTASSHVGIGNELSLEALDPLILGWPMSSDGAFLFNSAF